MKLEKLLTSLNYVILQGESNLEIEHIEYDSRKIKDKSMFICIKGVVTDGHKYATKAIELGAKVIVIQDNIKIDNEDITVVKVEDTRKAMAIIGRNYYGKPSEEFTLYGITGTNGKTTTAFLIEHILKSQGQTTGLIGTIENHIGNKKVESERTTPESLDLQKLFRQMKDNGADSVIMEVSSHALDLDRVYGAKYKVGVFTNLTQDHLDYHITMENYLKAKSKLFQMCEYGIINIDDDAAAEMIQTARCKKIYTFSTKISAADFYAKDIVITAQGSEFTLICDKGKFDVKIAMPGKFNVYNSLSALAATYAVGINIESAIQALGMVVGVPGRIQSVTAKDGFSVIVDYAHAPDGLLNVLNAIKEFAKGNIITVFGCGGDRDKTKRPIMGRIAGENSDFAIITSDNPRTEVPDTIIDEVEAGTKESGCPYIRITDRKEAILYAISKAQKDDVVLIAGKGHENYQILGTVKHHFDDMEIVLENI
ncbi:MAG: UDP-N-acetylmuramoyl-L-alanyl-D-glutamate--2,6-diaminopimelate ligase [Clostridiales bacterium]|jgi:UDP-N-acetylmuramoyl-L-alanyl-D-glutamate--2,6-diaminopimelate ligase|nr:UDP-N-acetylmuramoyl-L-alanyl-D-glutamate--2,6-diaminopimelate ligase [Clostridiales bacterium]